MYSRQLLTVTVNWLDFGLFSYTHKKMSAVLYGGRGGKIVMSYVVLRWKDVTAKRERGLYCVNLTLL